MDYSKAFIDDFKKAKEFWSPQFEKSTHWLRFASGGRGMWDSVMWDQRNQVDLTRPCMSVPMVNPYVTTVVSPVRKNPPSLAVKNADQNIELVVSGYLRGIEKASNSSEAYATAVKNSATCGIGWLRASIEDLGKLQVIRIKSEADPTAIMIDPQSVEIDGSDALYAFHIGTMNKDVAIETYGKEAGNDKESYDLLSWRVPKDSVADITYYYLAEKKYTKKQEAEEEAIENLEGTQETPEGEEMEITSVLVIERYVGCKKVFEAKIEGVDCLPIVPVYGERAFTDASYRYQGLVALIEDINKSLNVTLSNTMELVSLAPISPYIGSIDAIQGHETEWKNLNKRPPAILPINSYDSQGQPVAPPTRQDNNPQTQALQSVAVWVEGLFQKATGISDALLMGLGGANESGEALISKMEASSSATAEYIDHLTSSISQLGRAIIQMTPFVYNGSRQIILVDEYGMAGRATTDMSMILTPEIIQELDVEISTGPNLEMERKSTVQTLSMLAQSMGEKAGYIIPIIADNMNVTDRRKLKDTIAKAYPETAENQNLDPQTSAVAQEAQATIEMQNQALQNLQGIVTQLQQENAQLQTMAETTLAKAQMDNATRLEQERMKAEASYNLELLKQSGLDKRMIAQMTAEDQREVARFAQGLISKHTDQAHKVDFEMRKTELTPKLPVDVQNKIGESEAQAGELTSSQPAQE